MHETSDVATDPSATHSVGQNGNSLAKGTRDGIDITVVVNPAGRIVTAFPTNVAKNP